MPDVPRAVPDMRPASRLAGSAFKGLFSAARPSTAQPSHTRTSLAAVIEVDLNPPGGSLPAQELSQDALPQPEVARPPAVKPSGRLAGNALKFLGPSAGAVRRPRSAHTLAAGIRTAGHSKSASEAGKDSSTTQQAVQRSSEATPAAGPSGTGLSSQQTAGSNTAERKSAAAGKPSGKLAGHALKALATAAPR